MPHSICLDTNILFEYPFGGEKSETLRAEYEIIRKHQDPLLTKWAYIFLTENKLALSPLAVWEYASVRLRHLASGKTERGAFVGGLNALETVKRRFGVETEIDATTLAIAFLFASATGVPCDDAYHFVHAIRSSMEFFATKNKRDFAHCLKYSKEQIISRMIQNLEHNQPIGLICSFSREPCFIHCVSSPQIRKEIQKISKSKWPKIITTPVEIP